MKILMVVSGFNGLSQRIHRELTLKGHEVSVQFSISDEKIIEAVNAYHPDLILCPFLKERIPDCVWENNLCLIIHPGIEGDRGPSSLDWAISTATPEWGVTVLQADADLDAGDIWGSKTFAMRSDTKSNIYGREVTRCAAQIIEDIMLRFDDAKNNARSLDYENPSVKGCERSLMQQAVRQIKWNEDSTEEVMRKINAADGFPGVLDELMGEPVFLYGARFEEKLCGSPGELLAHNNSAICKATRDGAVWIRMARRKSGPERLRIKLPALQVLQSIHAEKNTRHLSLPRVDGCSDIWCHEDNGVAYLNFDFYNGAMNTTQCRALLKKYKSLKKRSVKTIVLMGGENFWNNGIQLNCIEAASNPAVESWQNIQAINDVVKEIIDSPNHITVAALRNNAGAGGAIMAMACDKVVLRDGVVINPHYKTMGLSGSEYWTYLLPRRVGESQAKIITRECMPMLAKEAILLGIGDELFDEDWSAYHAALTVYASDLASSKDFKNFIKEKRRQRKADEKVKRLKRYREEELTLIHGEFFDPNSEYHFRRKQFVRKIRPQETPDRIAIHQKESSEFEVNVEQVKPKLGELLN